MPKKGLGKGLGALFTDENTISIEPENGITELNILQVEPNKNQPRKTFDEDKLNALAESIQEHGLIQPIIVTKNENSSYSIVAGERRWRAAKKAGLTKIPAVVKNYSDQTVTEIALIENLQRADLNPIEEAEGYQQLISQYGMTQEQAAERVGKSRPAVANALRLLSLGPEILKLVEAGTISAGHARALLVLKTDGERMAVAQKVQNLSLSVRQTEALCKKMAKPPKEAPKEAPVAVDYVAECEKELKRTLGRGVRIVDGKRKGHIELEYYGQDDLQRLYEVLQSLSGRE